MSPPLPPRPQPRYTLEHGSYYLRDPNRTMFDARGEVMYMTDLVTIAYSCAAQSDGNRAWIVHKHGDLKDVQAWWQKNRDAAVTALVGEITLITFPRQFDPHRINAILDHPHLLGELLEEVKDEAPRTSVWDWLS